MELERARELLLLQVELGRGYNHNAAGVLIAKVNNCHGHSTVDQLIHELNLESHFGF